MILQDTDPFSGIVLMSAYVCLSHDSVTNMNIVCIYLSVFTKVDVRIMPLGTCYFSNLFCFIINNINLADMETRQLPWSVSLSILNMIDIWISIQLVIR